MHSSSNDPWILRSLPAAGRRPRLRLFCQKYNDHDLTTLTPLEIDEHLAEAGTGM